MERYKYLGTAIFSSTVSTVSTVSTSSNNSISTTGRYRLTITHSTRALHEATKQLFAMEPSVKSLQVVGLTSSLFLSGIYFASSHLTLPILYRLPTSTGTSVFVELYNRAVPVVVPLAVVSSLSSATVAYLDPAQRTSWAVAGALTLATMPWTIVVMMSTNKRLMELDESEVEREKAGSQEVVRLLKQWTWMNMTRSVMAMAGGLLGFWALSQ